MTNTTWEELWDARIEGMEKTFGPHAPVVLHAPVPFHIGQDLGGSPDVVPFPAFTKGTLYVTAELIGSEQPENSMGNYELAVAHEGDEQWGGKHHLSAGVLHTAYGTRRPRDYGHRVCYA